MYKIQIKAIKFDGFPEPPESVRQWQDLVDMPFFATLNEVGEWLHENNISVLEKFGLRFRVKYVGEEE